MTQYACYRVTKRRTVFLGTVEADSPNAAESMARLRWPIDWANGERLDVEEDDDE